MNIFGSFLCMVLIKKFGNRIVLPTGYGILSATLIVCGCICNNENEVVKYISLIIVNVFPFIVSSTLRGTRSYAA